MNNPTTKETSPNHGETTIHNRPPNTTLTLKIDRGHKVDRDLLSEELQPWISKEDWESFCDCYDKLSMDPILQHGGTLTKFSFLIALFCLVTVIVFGYLNNDDDDDDNNEQDDESSGVSTTTILFVALPILFPFVIVAWLNCRGAAMASRLKSHCRTSAAAWAARHPGVFCVTVEALDTVSNTDEVTELLLVKFTPALAANDDDETPLKQATKQMTRSGTEDMNDGSSCGNDANV